MSDLISRKALNEFLDSQIKEVTETNPDKIFTKVALKAMRTTGEAVKKYVNNMPTAHDVNNELRLLKNYLHHMPKIYGKRNQNWCIVRDLLMSGTSTAGMSSCIAKCRELGIDPYGNNLEGAVKDE